MPRYHRLGQLPAKKHIQFRRPDGGLYTEQLVSTHGFDDMLSTLYHINQPTEVSGWEDVPYDAPKLLMDEPLHHRHLKTNRLPARGDAVSGRVPLMGNQDCFWHQVHAAEPMEEYFKSRWRSTLRTRKPTKSCSSTTRVGCWRAFTATWSSAPARTSSSRAAPSGGCAWMLTRPASW